MTAERLEEIKETIQTLKEKKARAEGSMESIEKTWKKDYGISSIEEAEKKVEELDDEIKKAGSRLDKLGESIEDAADWDEL